MKLPRRVGRVLGHVLPLTLFASVMSLLATVFLGVVIVVFIAVCWCVGLAHHDGEGVQWAEFIVIFLKVWGLFFILAISRWMIEDHQELGRLWRVE